MRKAGISFQNCRRLVWKNKKLPTFQKKIIIKNWSQVMGLSMTPNKISVFPVQVAMFTHTKKSWQRWCMSKLCWQLLYHESVVHHKNILQVRQSSKFRELRSAGNVSTVVGKRWLVVLLWHYTCHILLILCKKHCTTCVSQFSYNTDVVHCDFCWKLKLPLKGRSVLRWWD